MRILCIGGSGYIGSQIYERLSLRHECESVDFGWFGLYSENNKKINYNSLEKEFINTFDVVIHTAAHSSVPMCNEDHYGAIKNNVIDFINLIQKINPKQKFIYASSSCVYIKTEDKDAVESDSLWPNDTLSFSKVSADLYLNAFNPCEWYSLRFGSVNGFSKNFRSDLMINSMTYSALKDGFLRVSNGEKYRPILGMRDLVNAVETIVETKHDQRGIYNISSFNTKINSVACKISQILNCRMEQTDNTASYDFSISSEKFEKSFKFHFNETINTIVESIVNNKDYLLNARFSARKGVRKDV